MSGRPVLAALVSGPSAVRKLLNSGANGLAASSSSASWRSVGRNSSKYGLATAAKRSVSLSATVELCSNVGSARKASANAWLASAAAWKVRSPLTIEPSSWWSRLASALKTTPVLCTSARTAPSWESRTVTSRLALSTNGSSWAKEALMSSPRPLIPSATACCQIWKSALVLALNAERMSSSVTDGSTWLLESWPPSGRNGPLWPSGISCT